VSQNRSLSSLVSFCCWYRSMWNHLLSFSLCDWSSCDPTWTSRSSLWTLSSYHAVSLDTPPISWHSSWSARSASLRCHVQHGDTHQEFSSCRSLALRAFLITVGSLRSACICRLQFYSIASTAFCWQARPCSRMCSPTGLCLLQKGDFSFLWAFLLTLRTRIGWSL
jgi:hypothetical protein